MKQLGMFVVVAVVFSGLMWPSGEPEIPALIRPADNAGAPPEDPRVTAFQTVEINPEAMAALARGGDELVLPLATGEKLILKLQPAELTALGGRLHRGHVKHSPESGVLLVEEDGRWAGSVDLAGGRYFNLLPAEAGWYRLEQVDLGRDPVCEGEEEAQPEWSEDGNAVMARDQTGMRVAPNLAKPPSNLSRYQRINLRALPRAWLENIRRPAWIHKPRPTPPTPPPPTKPNLQNIPRPPPPPARTTHLTPYGRGRAGLGFGSGGVGSPSGGGGSGVDLLIVYCAGVEKKYGGPAGLKSAAQLAVQMANAAYARSGVRMTLTLVHVAPVNYRSAGQLGGDLHNLTFKHPTLRKHVADLRERYRADLVSLVSSTQGGGVGWLLTNTKGSRRTGFNVLGAGSLRGYTLAHEVGHNLGCQHARGDRGVSRGLFPHGHGHRFSARDSQNRARQYRTIMAYAPGRRVGHFSNPTRSHLGQPTGTGKANNAAVINRTVGVVSAYY